MKKLTLAAILAALMIVGFGLSGPVLADPIIEVVPLEHDFGDIAVGTSVTTIITISNINGHVLVISSIEFGAGSSPDFSITMAPTLWAVLESGGSVDVEITFSPSAEGYDSAFLRIESNDPDNRLVSVDLGGVGIAAAPPPVTIAHILEFFDQSVEDGTLQGRGIWPRAAKARLKAFRYLLVGTDTLIEGGYTGWACFILERAFLRSDGLFRPPDFVAGDVRPELNAMIIGLMADLGCPFECPTKYYAYVSYYTDEEENNCIALQLVDQYGDPMANEQFEITLPDGTIVTDYLDENGSATIESGVSGPAKIVFPHLDRDSWQLHTD